MVLNGGEFNGKRLLKKATVDMMRTNVLSEAGAQLGLRHRPGALLAGAGIRL